jgi:hypothetical protein
VSAAAVAVGIVAGAGGMVVLPRHDGRRALEPVTPLPVARAQAAPVPEPADHVLLVWTPRRLPDGFAARVASAPGVLHATVVRGGLLDLEGSRDAEGHTVDAPPPGFSIPLDAMAFDRATFSQFAAATVRPAFDRLAPDQVLLGATSARLRRLGVGATMDLAGGRRVSVAGVVDDALIGAAEVALRADAPGAALVPNARYLLVAYDGERAGVEVAIRALAPPSVAVRFRGPGETPFFRQGDAVLAQVFVKERFGEFAYRRGPGKQIVEDPAWRATNVVTRTLPILGRVTCHKDLLPAFEGALDELVRRNLAYLVDPATFEGCWVPVLIEPGGDLSRHAWGAAVDVNYGKNPTGVASGQDPRLVDVMTRWGFTWGGHWLVPDPAHFEYLRLMSG